MWRINKKRCSFRDLIGNRRGASTLDYVIVLAGALVLALILYATMGDIIKPKLESVIPKIIRGEKVEIATGSGSDGGGSAHSHSGSSRSFGDPGHSESRGSFDSKPAKKDQVNNVAEIDASHRELRHLSDLAYFDVNQENKEEWAEGIRDELRKLQQEEKVDKNWELLEDDIEYDKKTAFTGMAFRNRETGEIVVSFRGTHETMHFVNDAQIVMQLPVFQKKDADKFIKSIEKKYGKDHSIVLTGHSFAGFLAQDQSVKTGYPAVTFNAVGMKPKPGRNFGTPKYISDQFKSWFNPNQNLFDDFQNAWGKYDNQIVNFVDENDLIGNYGVHYGKVVITGDGKKPKKFNDYAPWNQHRDNIAYKVVRDFDQLYSDGEFFNFKDHGLERFDEQFGSDGDISY